MMRVSPRRVGVDCAEIIHPRSGDIEAAADVERCNVNPVSHDVLQGNVRQLSAIPKGEASY